MNYGTHSKEIIASLEESQKEKREKELLFNLGREMATQRFHPKISSTSQIAKSEYWKQQEKKNHNHTYKDFWWGSIFLHRNLTGQETVGWYIQTENLIQVYFTQQSCHPEMEER